jgi:5-hydroxyisourate hydrolase-like protein (transthyretin family)
MKNISTIIIAAGLLVFSFSACQKKTDCTANITCNDTQGKPMNGVEVRLFANVKTSTNTTKVADVKATGVTDKDGKVSFIFKLPAIFDVNASVGTSTATALIKLEEGKTTEKTVEIK